MNLSHLNRRQFLLASAAAATLSRPVRAATTTRPDHVIVAIARGGWDTTFSLDPKLGHKVIEGPVSRHETKDDVEYLLELNQNQVVQCNDYRRPAVRTFFENWGSRTAVLNGQFVGSITHDPCRLRILTGTADFSSPDFATVFGYEFGRDLPLGSIDFSASSFPGPLAATTGRVGHRNQLRALLDPELFMKPAPGATDPLPLRRLDLSERDLIRDFMERRADRFRGLVGEGGANDRHVDDLLESIDRRDRVLEVGPELVGDLMIGEEPSLEQQTSLAVDLLTKGLCRSITLKDAGNWDTHRANDEQHVLHEHFFRTIDNMLHELQAAGMLERTLVFVCSEMGRTPRINADAGKDHWGHTTQLLVGGGVNGGHRFGGTDDYGEGQWVDFATGEVFAKGERMKYDNVVAGILHMLDVDPEKWLPGVKPFLASSLV